MESPLIDGRIFLSIALAIIAVVMFSYWAFMSTMTCVAGLDRSLDSLMSSRVGGLARAWLRVSAKVRLVPVATALALLLIAVPWFAFPYAGRHCFRFLRWGAVAGVFMALVGWWTWALARQYRGGRRLVNLGTALGLLYLLAILEGTMGYFYWVFSRGYWLDFPPP